MFYVTSQSRNFLWTENSNITASCEYDFICETVFAVIQKPGWIHWKGKISRNLSALPLWVIHRCPIKIKQILFFSINRVGQVSEIDSTSVTGDHNEFKIEQEILEQYLLQEIRQRPTLVTWPFRRNIRRWNKLQLNFGSRFFLETFGRDTRRQQISWLINCRAVSLRGVGFGCKAFAAETPVIDWLPVHCDR